MLDIAAIQAEVGRYRQVRHNLIGLGVLSGRESIEGALGEVFACHYLGLRRNASQVEKGYDALDADGRRHQIKARQVGFLGEKTSFDAVPTEGAYDVLVCVHVSFDLELLAIYTVPSAVVEERVRHRPHDRRFRWTKDTPSMTGVTQAWPSA